MSDELELDMLRWPRAGDDPLQLPGDRRFNAYLSHTYSKPWWVRAEGFKRLADLGVAESRDRQLGRDYVVYPILSNYRQYLELSIKALILEGRELFDEQGAAPRGHDLIALWNVAESLLHRIEPQSAPTYRDVRECLARFNAMDATSQELRYPVTTGGRPSLAGIHEIDLHHVHDVVERLAAFWDAAATEISVYLEYKSEMMRDYAPT